MGRSDEECELIYQAGILHDIGKIATPDSILLKPGKLTELEYELIKVHVNTSYELLSKIPMYKEIAEVIKSHHERYDGNGYPEGKEGKDIMPLARIMIVADAFDAMTTNRIYKGRKSVAKAIEELIAGSSIQFHPEVIKVAKEVLSNVVIEESVNQLPITDIENERFSYFFRDQITNSYNSGYLNLILNTNAVDNKYSSLNIVYLHNFNQYNQQNSWEDGDILLNKISNCFYKLYPLSLVFRIHGDDFIIIDKEENKIDVEDLKAFDVFKELMYVYISTRYIDLKKDKISSLKELESLL
jgi:putative nucleotidyltransferase with HDIG domain